MPVTLTGLNRREFLTTGSLVLCTAGLPKWVAAGSASLAEYRLTAQPGLGYFLGAPYPRSSIWCYNQALPGPVIRAKQGQKLRIVLDNTLDEATTLHCHGIRLPNAMDGVPGLTQKPVKKGESFVYEFDLPDAGTYWYHPHFNSSEQIGRGLYGPLVIEEAEPVYADKDLILVLDDWRLTDDFQVNNNFSNGHDRSHAGRIGNTVTVNGRVNPNIQVNMAERLRLRLINAANARTFSLDFSSFPTQVIAIDGHPVTPHEPDKGMVSIAAAMRVDLVVDVVASPAGQLVIRDSAYRNQRHEVFTLVNSNQKPVREKLLDSPVDLKPNTMPEPDLSKAVEHEVVLAGGAMGGMRGAMIKGEWQTIRQLAGQGMVWALNGNVGVDHTVEPLISLKLGQSCKLRLINNTVFDHPMHLHGYAFKVLTRNGKPAAHHPWQDTVMVSRDETVEIAFVADNPGDWMFHCHVLEHQISGMSSIIRVT